MKAVVCTQYGGPEVLTVSNVPEPTVKSNELLIRIKATSANSGEARIRALDAPKLMKGMMRLIMGWSKPRNPILGNVYAGTVEKSGDRVSKFQVGDRVFGSTGFTSGGYAEKIAVKEASPIAKIPTNATFEEAAALPFGGQTALHFIQKLNILRDGNVLVYGASGAVGTMAIQLLSLKGVQVTAVCSERNHSLVTSLGADRSLDYQKREWIEDLTTYDLIFDCVGKLSKKEAKPRLKTNGTYVTVGGTEVSKESAQFLQELAALHENNQIKAVIDRTYPLEQIVEAHEYLDTKRKRGNIILTID